MADPAAATAATQASASATNAPATVTVSAPTAPGTTTYVTGIILSASGAIAAPVVATLTNVAGSGDFKIQIPAITTKPIALYFWTHPLAINGGQDTTLTLPALGTGITGTATLLTFAATGDNNPVVTDPDPLGITSLVAALGGDSKVLAFYDARTGITLDGSNNLATWDDARGSVGFGPQRVASGSPAPAVTSNEVICDGSQNYYATATSSVFDLSAVRTYIWIGTMPVGVSQYAVNIQDNPLGSWDSIGPQGNGKIGARFTGGTDTRIAPSNNRRMFVWHYAGVSTDPNGGDNPKWVKGHARLPSSIYDNSGNGTSGNRILSVGLLLDRTFFSATKERAMIAVDHALSVTEYNALVTWASTHHSIVPDVGQPAIICDGNSLTNGLGTASDPETTSYPALIGSNFPTYDVLNAGVNGRTGQTQLAVLPTRILPLYNAARGNNIYVYWEGINDLVHTAQTVAEIEANTANACLAAKNLGFKVVVLTCMKAAPITSNGRETDRQTYNAYLLANYSSFAHAVVDVASNPHFSDYTNTTYFNADQTHLTDAGYDEVANNATYGVTQAINGLP